MSQARSRGISQRRRSFQHGMLDRLEERTLLSADLVYVAKPGLSGVTASYSPANNTMYEQLESTGADLKTALQGTTQSSVSGLPAAATAGIITTRAAAHVAATQIQYLGQSLAELPTIRAYIARMRIKTDMVRTLPVSGSKRSWIPVSIRSANSVSTSPESIATSTHAVMASSA